MAKEPSRRPRRLRRADRRHLRASPIAERAVQEKRYQKSRWEHWDVPLAKMDLAIRAAVGRAEDELARLRQRLWSEPVWDLKMVAARILRNSVAPDGTSGVRDGTHGRSRRLGGRRQSGGRRIAVSHRRAAPTRRRRDLVESRHLWTRRAALVVTLPWTKAGCDPERTLAWAARLAEDRQWFIQKAIGWWLRELSKRDPERVRRFLADHGAALKSVARREATKYLAD